MKAVKSRPSLPGLAARFGIRSGAQLLQDLRTVASHLLPRDMYTFDLGSAALLRPEHSLPAYAGFVPNDGMAPIFNFFDRVGGGKNWRATVTRKTSRDWRGGRLTYDEHDGTDFICPPGTPVVAAAPGVVVAQRDRWLRGGLTACVDHGRGLVTQYTHLTSLLVEVGQAVERGEPIALSGHSGFDMTSFFPWVPPHLHFMVWIDGRPVDPYLSPGEPPLPGTWAERNAPRPARGPLPGDVSPSALRTSPVLSKVIEEAVPQCIDPDVRAELERAPNDAARAAILEDSFHHDRHLWPQPVRARALRPQSEPPKASLTLPLGADLYCGARAADTRGTQPR